MSKKLGKVFVVVLLSSLFLGAMCNGGGPKPKVKIYYPVTNDVIKGFLKQRQVNFSEKNGVFFYQTPEKKTIGIKLYEKEQALWIVMLKIYNLPLEDNKAGATLIMLAALMYINNQLLAGKAEWDLESGDVHFGVTLPVENGISYEEFNKYLTYVEKTGIKVISYLKDLEKSLQEGEAEPGKVKPGGEWQ